MTPQTTPDAYIGYLDEVMSRAGTDGKSGHVGMLEDLGDRHTASAVANTLFHDGYAGHKQLHEAAKNTINGIDLKLREERGLSIPSGLTGHQSDTWDVIRWIDEQKLGHVFRANLKKSGVECMEKKRSGTNISLVFHPTVRSRMSVPEKIPISDTPPAVPTTGQGNN